MKGTNSSMILFSYYIGINTNMIKTYMIFLSIGSAIFERKERWTLVGWTTQKMVKSENYDQVSLEVFSLSW